MRKAILASVSVLALMFMISCTGPAGPAGATGASGATGSPGPNLYLTDGSTRIYSGGILNLGSLLNGTTVGTSKPLSLFNNAGLTMKVATNGTTGMVVSPTSGYFIRNTGISNTWDINSPSGGNGKQLGDIWVTTDMPATPIPQGSSAQFDVIFTPYAYTVQGESHQDYNIALSDSSGNPYNFTFEVYGVISC